MDVDDEEVDEDRRVSFSLSVEGPTKSASRSLTLDIDAIADEEPLFAADQILTNQILGEDRVSDTEEVKVEEDSDIDVPDEKENTGGTTSIVEQIRASQILSEDPASATEESKD